MRVVLPDFLGGSQSPATVLLKLIGIAIYCTPKSFGIHDTMSFFVVMGGLCFFVKEWHRIWYFNIEEPRKIKEGTLPPKPTPPAKEAATKPTGNGNNAKAASTNNKKNGKSRGGKK